MKKLFIILSALALTVVGCTQYIEETPTPRVYVASPSISLVEVKDSSITVDVTVPEGTGYFSVVAKEGMGETLDSMRLFKLNVSPCIFAQTQSASTSKTMRVALDDLEPYTNYTVYAVSSSTQGSVGNVTFYTLMTSDNVAPYLTNVLVVKDTVVTLTFSENVELVPDAEFSVKYYAVNKGIYDDEPQGIITNEGVHTVVAGNQVALYVSGLPVGAYFNLAYSAGAFRDAALNRCKALEHSPFEKSSKGTPTNASSASGRRATESFDLSIYGGKPVEVVTSLANPIWISVPENYQHYKANTAGVNGTIIYQYVDGGAIKTDIYPTGCTSISQPAGYQFDFGWSKYNCALVYPNISYYSGRPDPVRGAYITIQVPVFLTDIYGNQNNTLTIGPFLYSYGYTLDDVIGNYDVTADGYFSGKEVTFNMTVEKSDDAQKGNVMITEIFGTAVDKGKAIYADFDVDMGTLTIADWQPFLYSEKYNGYFYFTVNGADSVTLSMPSSGTLGDPDNWFGIYLQGESASGWSECYTTFDAVKSASETLVSVNSTKDFTLHTSDRILK